MTTPLEPLDVRFASSLPGEYRAALEKLVFAHPLQGRMRLSILDNIHAHGVPRIAGADALRVEIERIPAVQNLFVLAETGSRANLLGFVLYTRADDFLDILFLAVRQAFTAGGRLARFGLTYRIMDELKRIARRVRGVAGVRLRYRRCPPLVLPVETGS